jgi:hypothetical protein
MEKILTILLGATIFLGCAHMHTVSNDCPLSVLEKINKKSENNKLVVNFKNGNSLSSKGIFITSDTITVFGDTSRIFKTTDISDITIINKKLGMYDGAKIGYLSFASAGLLFALFESNDILVSKQQKILISFTVLGGIGCATGAILGFPVGRRDKYVFEK